MFDHDKADVLIKIQFWQSSWDKPNKIPMVTLTLSAEKCATLESLADNADHD